MKVLHGFTGSVATKLSPKLAEAYTRLGVDTKIVYSQSAKVFDSCPYNFPRDRNYEQYAGLDYANYFYDEDEWAIYRKDNTVLHIDLIKWADAFVIAPLSANTLAKMANGICDNLLTCCARAWNFEKPFIVAPSMNDRMYSHPITNKHLDTLREWGIIVVPPQTKELFCGDVGLGAMANIDDILKEIKL